MEEFEGVLHEKRKKVIKHTLKYLYEALNDRKKSTKTGKNFRGGGEFLAGQNIFPCMVGYKRVVLLFLLKSFSYKLPPALRTMILPRVSDTTEKIIKTRANKKWIGQFFPRGYSLFYRTAKKVAFYFDIRLEKALIYYTVGPIFLPQ